MSKRLDEIEDEMMSEDSYWDSGDALKACAYLLARLRKAESLLRETRQYVPPRARIDLCLGIAQHFEEYES